MGIRYTYAESESFRTEPVLVEKTITTNGSYDAASDNADGYSVVNVNVEGGGGSSDFSTAEVTVINNTGELIDGRYVSVVDTPISTVRPMNTLSFNSSRTYIVPLYKGSCNWAFDGTANVSVSGDIEWNSENRTALITGDCTITIS